MGSMPSEFKLCAAFESRMRELGEKSLNIDMGMNLDRVQGKGSVDGEAGFERELEDCRNRCCELEERSRKAEERCKLLELEIEKKKSEFELLEGKFGALEVEKLAIEVELGVLKKRNDELEERITRIENENKAASEGERVMGKMIDLMEEDREDQVFQSMIENKVLDREKKKAESEVDVWKEKTKELELQVLELESLVLRSGEHPLDAKMTVGLGLPEMGTKEMTEARRLKDGSDVPTSLEHLQNENKMVDSDEIIHAMTSVGPTCYPPAKGILNLQASGGTPVDTPFKQSMHIEGGKGGSLSETGLKYGSRVRKQLVFGEEGSPHKKMAPSTPGGARPASGGVIDISDSDDEPDNTHLHMPTLNIQGNKMVCVSIDCASGGPMGNDNELTSNSNLKKTLLDQSDDEDMGGYKRNVPFISTPKRKRAFNIVTSDSESDDDNVPICKLKRKNLQESDPNFHLNSCSATATGSGDKVTDSVTRRRLATLRSFEVKDGQQRSSPSNLKSSETKYHPAIPTNEHVEDDEMEEDGSESEGESLGGFIVDSSDISDGIIDSSDNSDGDDAHGESEDVSDGNVDFGEILCRIRRNRDQKVKWEFEADMLADFGKDPELCMKAVCALYRQQTSEEKSSKETIYSNKRGFSQCDALRGTTLAEFLTDGDPKGDLKKSVKELQVYDTRALELCRTLATHYSKQLFAIYKNEEDPFFLSS